MFVQYRYARYHTSHNKQSDEAVLSLLLENVTKLSVGRMLLISVENIQKIKNWPWPLLLYLNQMHEATLAPEGLYTTSILAPEISAMRSVLRLSILIEMSKQNRI
jgi:hypothetical protein